MAVSKAERARTTLSTFFAKPEAPALAGVQLGSIEYVAPTALQGNIWNQEFFLPETEEYYRQLKDDIQARGIIVPLIAKSDGTLLAGHNRLRIAQELSLERIPVQYVASSLTSDEEKLFLIKDNLLRRHLTLEQRITLYRVLYPNFDERIAQRLSVGQFGDARTNDSSSQPLTAVQIATDTGQTVSAVRKQLQRMKTGKNDESTAAASSKKSTTKKLQLSASAHTMIDTVKEFYRALTPKEQKAFRTAMIEQLTTKK